MTDFGRKAGLGDMLKSVYDTDNSGVVDAAPAHKTTHQDAGADEISVAGLSGELADNQNSTWAKVSSKPTTFPPTAHKASHQDGGSDEIALTGLAGATPLAILGDATAGRLLRSIFLTIDNGSTGPTLKCTVSSQWNGDTIAETDNIAKDATTGSFTLNAAGTALLIEAAGLSGNVVCAIGVIYQNLSGTALTVNLFASSNDIYITLLDATAGTAIDMTTLIDTGAVKLIILYITDT